MNGQKHIVEDIKAIFASSSYPADFLEAYDQMECLACHDGRETFLVRKKSDGLLAVASCYERRIFPIRPDIDCLKELASPGLPRYYGQYENDEMLCIVREYIKGETLDAYALDRHLSVRDIIALLLLLCDILETLHTHVPPVVHRDIKPENIIVRPDGSLVLIDFDIARVVRAGAGSDTVLFGTRGYAPPEQYGFGQTDARADIYAFGVLLRFLVTGSTRENPNITIRSDLQAIIDRCTAFSPKERYRHIGQVKKALKSAAKRKRRIGAKAAIVAVLLAFFMLAAGFAAGRYTDWLRPKAYIRFQEPLIEEAVRLQLGRERGSLTEEEVRGVKGLYIYGTRAFSAPESFYRCVIDESTRGAIRSLDDLKLLPGLEEMHIVHQGYVDASGIAGLASLKVVELKHLRLSSASPVGDVPGLYEAVLFDAGLSDVNALKNCPWLRTLDIGRNDITSLAQIGSHPNVQNLGLMWLDMDNLDDIAEKLPKVKNIALQHSSVRDLSGLGTLPALEEVYVLPEQAEEVSAALEGTDVRVTVLEK